MIAWLQLLSINIAMGLEIIDAWSLPASSCARHTRLSSILPVWLAAYLWLSLSNSLALTVPLASLWLSHQYSAARRFDG